MQKDSKIYVAGHRGLVGSAILQELQKQGYTNLVYKTHKELDLINQKAVQEFFAKEKPEYVFFCAAKAGGIAANSVFRADFIYQNLMIECNVVHNAYLNGIKKLIFIASTAIYPKNSILPTDENQMLQGDLEYSNKPYAVAKIAGLMMCESYNLQYGTNFIGVAPTNLYGNNDNFDLENSHVLPAVLRKMHLAKLLKEGRSNEVLADLKMSDFKKAKDYLASFGVSENTVEIWGSGKPTREFVHSKDLAGACLHIMKNIDFRDLCKGETMPQNTHINISPNVNISIKNIAELIKEIVGFQGRLVFNTERPDGAMQKLTSGLKLESLGWKHKINLEQGIKMMYQWYLTQGLESSRRGGGQI
ncbi:GDP-L-fucose synthase [uncultured Helicobacter sp.]|uniref:GDP-L-fucose synthase family protein n=1 Tax=uncultured Helicobacter sp. TaxID=175537 RepID=UPI00261632FA|nr:GDP-L-fucose synthase [uncultured Helicobacter sp.]